MSGWRVRSEYALPIYISSISDVDTRQYLCRMDTVANIFFIETKSSGEGSFVTGLFLRGGSFMTKVHFLVRLQLEHLGLETIAGLEFTAARATRMIRRKENKEQDNRQKTAHKGVLGRSD
jgi:hypothetical protein